MKVSVSSLKGAGVLSQMGELPPLSVGEVVSVKVMGFLNGKYQVTLKGRQLEAEAKMPLQVGDRIKVKIAALEPRVILVPVEVKDGSKEYAAAVKTFLRLFRQQPDLLGEVFTQGQRIFAPHKTDIYGMYVSKELIGAIADRLKTIMAKGTEVKDLAYSLGLFHERDIAAGTNNQDNLKSLLLKLAGELETSAERRPKEVEELARWVASTLSRLETCQVVNIISRDREGLFFLPLPFVFGGELRIGEFYGEVAKNEDAKECGAWIFVDPPRLGPILVEMRLLGERLSVLVHCEKSESRDFLSDRVAQLKQRLDAAGFPIASLVFTFARELDERRRDLWQRIPAYREGTLQVTI